MCQGLVDELLGILFPVKDEGSFPTCRYDEVGNVCCENSGGIVNHDEHVPVESYAFCGNFRELFVACGFTKATKLYIDLLEEFCVRWEIV